jgi:Condensation domain
LQVSAIRVVKECRKQSLDIGIQELLLAKGISHIASNLQGKSNGSSRNLAAEKETGGVNYVDGMFSKDTYPCTPLQQAMIEKHAEGFYNVEMVFQIHYTGELDIKRLRDAWSQVVQRHSALRTIFMDSSDDRGKYVQQISDTKVPTINEELQSETCSLVIDVPLQPSPVWLAGEIPHRLTVQRTSDGKAALKLVISHATIDAVSLGTLFRELELAYDGRLQSKHAPQFPEYLKHIWHQAKQDGIYWREYCANASPCHIPRLPSKPSEKHMELVYTPVTMPGAAEISSFCRQQGVTVANLIHTVWALVLKLHSHPCNEVLFGYLVSGRDLEIEGVDEIIGPLISMLICRKELTDELLLRNLLTDLRHDAIQSSARKFCETKDIEQELGLDQVLFNTMINFR